MSFGKFKDSSDNDKEKKEVPNVFNDKLRSLGKGAESATAPSSGKAFLGKGAKISGTLVFQGPAEIDAEVEGEIQSSDLLVIGEAAVVRAKIIGTDVIVRGQVTGDIICRSRVALEKPARINGNISCPVLRIEEGVLFEGNCSMAKSA